MPPADPQRQSDALSSVVLEARIGSVTSRLMQAIAGILETLPGSVDRPVDLSRSLGLNKDLSSKLLVALRRPDPLAAAYLMPGPEALRTLLRAAQRRKVDSAVVREAEDSIVGFEELVRTLGGSQSSLEAVISGWLPEARARFEMANKQGAYKHIANLKGVTTELALDASIIAPSKNNDLRFDGVHLRILRGLRRLRPRAPVQFINRLSGGDPQRRCQALSGEPVDASGSNVVLAEYSTHPLPAMKVTTYEKIQHFQLQDDLLGLASAVDLTCGVVVPEFFQRYTNAERPRKPALGTEVAIPARTQVLDVILHNDVWRAWGASDPELHLFDIPLFGSVSPNDPASDRDRLNMLEVVQPLGLGVATCRISGCPRYVDLLREVCKRCDWNPEEFRGFRCRIPYPVYGSSVFLAFDRPMST